MFSVQQQANIWFGVRQRAAALKCEHARALHKLFWFACQIEANCVTFRREIQTPGSSRTAESPIAKSATPATKAAKQGIIVPEPTVESGNADGRFLVMSKFYRGVVLPPNPSRVELFFQPCVLWRWLSHVFFFVCAFLLLARFLWRHLHNPSDSSVWARP